MAGLPWDFQNDDWLKAYGKTRSPEAQAAYEASQGGGQSAPTMITNDSISDAGQDGGDWFSQAAAGYNDNPLAGVSPDGGPAYRPDNMQMYNGNTNPILTGNWGSTGSDIYGGGSGGINLGSGTSGRIGGAGSPSPAGGPGSGGGSGPGTPIPGGSFAQTIGATPSVNSMATPYGGGPSQTMASAGFDPSKGGSMPTDMMTMYRNFLQDPSSAKNNPMYKAMMDQGLQATERGMLAKGYQGSGNMATELQKTGMGIAGQYLPQMAQMYGQGAGTEASRYDIQNRANLGQGQLGLNQWNATSQDQLNRATAQAGANQDTLGIAQMQRAQLQMQPLINNLTMQTMMGY